MNKNILIVDDHEAARMGLASALDGAGFTVVGSVATGGEAIDAIKKLQIDLILMDVRMPQSDGLTTLGKIRKLTQAAIVMLSAYDNPTYVARATALGAQDYVVKSGENSELLDSLRLAVEGEGPAHQGRMARVQYEMQKEVRSDSLPKEFPLTSREGQVLRHIALGLSNKEIAKSLGISVETVKEHVQNVLRKVKANDRTDAAVRAIKSGLIS
jgi:DNA-binding NarL/FixJ family response regulator